MVICPNKNLPQWKALSEAIGERFALLAFFRNNNQIPTVDQARELTSDRESLEQFERIERVEVEDVEKMMVSLGAVYEGSTKGETGDNVFSLKNDPNQRNILNYITDKYGPIFNYLEDDLVSVSTEALEMYNKLFSNTDTGRLSVTQLAKRFLYRIGVTVDEHANELLNRYGTNAIADIGQRMVAIRSGFTDVALPEEAMHFFLEMLPQDDPILIEALDKIRLRPIYKATLEEYKNKEGYNVDGQIRFDKIRKEALAKELAASLKKRESQTVIGKLLDRIMNWIKGVNIEKDPMRRLEEMFLSEEIGNLNRNITSKEIFFQLADDKKKFYEAQPMNEEQKSTLDKLLLFTAKVDFNPEGHKYTYQDGRQMVSVTTVLGSDFYSDLDSPDIIADIIDKFEMDYPDVTDPILTDKENSKRLVEKLLEEMMSKALTKEDLENIAGKRVAGLIVQAMENKRKTLFGTAIHEIMESLILGKSVDLQKISKDIEYFMDAKTLQQLIYEGTPGTKAIIDIIKELKADGSVLVTEFQVGNGQLGGIIDLLAIKKDGSVDVYDFKTKFLREHVASKKTVEEEFFAQINIKPRYGIKSDPNTIPFLIGQRRSRKEQYGQQQGLYKHLLMEAGIPVGKLNIIGIPYTIDKTTGRIESIQTVMVPNLPFDKNLGQYFFENVDYNNDVTSRPRELREDPRLKELENMSKEKMKEAFARMTARINQVYDFFIRKKDSRIADILVDEDSTTDSVSDQLARLEKILENFDDFKSEMQRQKNFIEMIDATGPIVSKISKAFNDLRQSVPTDAKARAQKLNELMKMKDFLMSYQRMFEEMLSYMSDTIDTTSPEDAGKHMLVNRIKEMMSEITNIRNAYVETITPDIADSLGEVFTPELIDNIKREINEMIASARIRKDMKRVAELEKMKSNLPDKKVITEYLKGKKGDVGYFFSYLAATISNPDLVVAGVAKRLKSALDRVRLINKKLRDSLATELEKRNKVYGRGLDMKARNESLVYDVESIEESTGEKYMKRVLKTEFDLERLHADHTKLKIALREEKAKENNEDGIKRAKDALRDFEKKYFEGNFTEEYDKLTAVLDTVVTYKGEQRSLRDIRNEMFDRINSVTARYHPEDIQAGAMSVDDVKELANHWANYHALTQKLDEYGKPKTGEDLRIAELLEKYKEDTKDIYEYIELKGAYERAHEKVKIIFGENSEEHKKWLAANTRIVVKDEFYTRMEEILQEMNTIIPDEKNIEVTELYKELRKLTNAYKDKDNNIQGHLMDTATVERVKAIEERIRELKVDHSMYTSSGLTYEEQKKLNKLRDLRSERKPYNEIELDRLVALGKNRREQMQEEQERKIDLMGDFTTEELKEKSRRYNELKKELIGMRKMEINPHYYEELHRRMDDFARSIGLNNRLDVEKDAIYLEQFQETEWFRSNHKFSSRSSKKEDEDFDEDDDNKFGFSYEPIYIWKRSMPIEKYTERKPATHFYKRRVKESYVNKAGETIKLVNKDNRDILNRKKPKSNDAYRAINNADHPYLNKEYVGLRTKVQNNTASDKERVDYENLVYLYNTMTEAQQKIEMSQRLGYAIPFMEKTKTDRLVESKGQNVKDSASGMFTAVKRAFTRTEDDIDEGIPTTSNEASRVATVDNEQIKYIPVRYRSKGELANASYDVWGGVLNYVASINRKVEMETELAFINGLEEVLGDKMNQPKSETGNLVFNRIFKKYNMSELEEKINSGSNRRLDVIKSFVNSVMYNEEYFAGIDIMGINTQKAVSNIMGLSSFSILAAAPLNWATNWISGNVQNFVEAIGGKIFNVKDMNDAKGIVYGNGIAGGKYGSVMKDMMSDYDKVGNFSFWGQMMELFDPIQGEFENEYGQKTKFNKVKNILKLGAYSGKVWGEWEIQMSSFIAFMRAHKIYNGEIVDRETYITKRLGVDPQNSMTPAEFSKAKAEALKEFNDLKDSLLDIFEMKDGQIAVKDQFKDVFEIGGKQFSDVVANLHALQKRLNGSYASFDKSWAEKTSIGRMMFFFRKYVIPLAVNRWGEMRTNYESMTLEQGFYLTFTQTMLQDLIKFRFNIIQNWNNYSDSEKRAIKKTLADMGVVIAIWTMYSLLLGWDDDDEDRFKKLKEKGWGHQALLFVLLKTRSETEQFLPLPGYGLNEIQRIYSNPSLIFNEVTRYIDIAGLLVDHAQDVVGINDDNLYYKSKIDDSGLRDKGDSKLFAKTMGILGYTGRSFNPADAVKSFEYAQKLK
jgi:hypothetical protein